MMEAPCFDDLVKVICRTFNCNDVEITFETRSCEVPGWDSLSHVLLVLELQNEFNVPVQPDETVFLPDVGALYDLLINRIADR